MSYIEYINIREERVKRIFEEMLKNYPPLHAHRIILEQKKLRKTTMRAQPLMKAYFTRRGFRSFLIQFSNATELDDKISMEEVPDEVIAGWFAHELGHVMDYLHRGFVEMIVFGVRYVSSRRYRKKVEHAADEYAIEHGMAEEILATKKYILDHSDLPDSYKERIRKYYMSEKDVHKLVAQLEEFQPDDANIFDVSP